MSPDDDGRIAIELNGAPTKRRRAALGGAAASTAGHTPPSFQLAPLLNEEAKSKEDGIDIGVEGLNDATKTGGGAEWGAPDEQPGDTAADMPSATPSGPVKLARSLGPLTIQPTKRSS